MYQFNGIFFSFYLIDASPISATKGTYMLRALYIVLIELWVPVWILGAHFFLFAWVVRAYIFIIHFIIIHFVAGYNTYLYIYLAPDFYMFGLDLHSSPWQPSNFCVHPMLFMSFRLDSALVYSFSYLFSILFVSSPSTLYYFATKCLFIYLFLFRCVCSLSLFAEQERKQLNNLKESKRKTNEQMNERTKENKFYAMKMKNYVAVKQSISISLDNTLWEMRLMCCSRGDFISHELHTRYKSPSDSLKKLSEKN